MAELNVRFDVRFTQAQLRLLLVVLVTALSVTDVGSESVTLNTYYPAPSGVYNYMITTNSTVLARDANNVTIGGAGANGNSKLTVVSGGASIGFTAATGAAPANGLIVSGNTGIGTSAPGALLDVQGEGRLGKLQSTGGNTYNPADPHAADIVLGSDAGVRHDSSIMFWSVASASRILGNNDSFYFSTWNVDGLTAANVKLGASNVYNYIGGSGAGTSFGQRAVPYSAIDAGGDGVVTARETACSITSYGNGIQPCPAGKYATLASGLYNQYWGLAAVVYQSVSGGQGTMLCCSNPSSGGANPF